MEWYEFYDVGERYIELINPSSIEKVLRAGEVAGMHERMQVIDFGCGFAEPLVQWAEAYGISGVGIEFRERAATRAKEKVGTHGLSERIRIVHGNAAEFEFAPGSYDVAVCLGASFIWEGYGAMLKVLRTAIKPGGRMIVGEPYWRSRFVPEDVTAREKIHTEEELLALARAEGLVFEYVMHSNRDEWDRYEAGNWRGICAWLRENPSHPEREAVEQWLRKWQDDYVGWGREFLGWGIYVLAVSN